MIEDALSNAFNRPMKIKISIIKKSDKTNSSELLNYATKLMGTPVTE